MTMQQRVNNGDNTSTYSLLIKVEFTRSLCHIKIVRAANVVIRFSSKLGHLFQCR